MKHSLISGLAGSLALTLLHETLRQFIPEAPRMDKMGEQGLKKLLTAADLTPPSDDSLYGLTLGGDIISNAGYYSLVGINSKSPVTTGAALGLAAGVGAVMLPDKLGLDAKYSNSSTTRQVLTVLVYLTGGVVAGLVHSKLSKKKIEKEDFFPANFHDSSYPEAMEGLS